MKVSLRTGFEERVYTKPCDMEESGFVLRSAVGLGHAVAGGSMGCSEMRRVTETVKVGGIPATRGLGGTLAEGDEVDRRGRTKAVTYGGHAN